MMKRKVLAAMSAMAFIGAIFAIWYWFWPCYETPTVESDLADLRVFEAAEHIDDCAEEVMRHDKTSDFDEDDQSAIGFALSTTHLFAECNDIKIGVGVYYYPTRFDVIRRSIGLNICVLDGCQHVTVRGRQLFVVNRINRKNGEE